MTATAPAPLAADAGPPLGALLNVAVYEPRPGTLEVQAADPLRAGKTYLDHARAICLGPATEYGERAREAALRGPAPTAETPTVTVTFPGGSTVDLPLAPEELPQLLWAIYAIEGWSGIVRAGDAVTRAVAERMAADEGRTDRFGNRASDWALDPRNQTSDRSGYPPVYDVIGQPGALQSTVPAPGESERWMAAEEDFDAARELLALAIIDGLEALEQRAEQLVVEGLKRASEFVTTNWARYGVQWRDVVEPGGPATRVVRIWTLSDEAQRKSLRGVLEAYFARKAELLEVRRVIANARKKGIPASLVAQERELVKKVAAELHAAADAHPLAAIAGFRLSPGFKDDQLARAVGAPLLEMRAAVEELAARPPAKVHLLRTRERWPVVLRDGPARALAAELSRFDPLANEDVLLAMIEPLRKERPAEYLVLVDLLETLTQFREERPSDGGWVAAVALPIASFGPPPLRAVAVGLEIALALRSAVDAVHYAIELGERHKVAVVAHLAGRDEQLSVEALQHLGKLFAAAPGAGGVVLELLKGAVSIAAVAAGLAGVRPATVARLDALDFLLGIT